MTFKAHQAESEQLFQKRALDNGQFGNINKNNTSWLSRRDRGSFKYFMKFVWWKGSPDCVQLSLKIKYKLSWYFKIVTY